MQEIFYDRFILSCSSQYDINKELITTLGAPRGSSIARRRERGERMVGGPRRAATRDAELKQFFSPRRRAVGISRVSHQEMAEVGSGFAKIPPLWHQSFRAARASVGASRDEQLAVAVVVPACPACSTKKPSSLRLQCRRRGGYAK